MFFSADALFDGQKGPSKGWKCLSQPNFSGTSAAEGRRGFVGDLGNLRYSGIPWAIIGQ